MRYFPLGDVLSVATGRVLSKGYLQGYLRILSYMWRQSCTTDMHFLAMYPECQLWILKQYPQFGTVEMETHLARLDQQLSLAVASNDEKREVVFTWLDELAFIFGERFLVAPVPRECRRPINAVEEAALIMGPGRLLKITEL